MPVFISYFGQISSIFRRNPSEGIRQGACKKGPLHVGASLSRPLQIVAVAAILINARAVTYLPSQVTPPAPLREMRGVWVATVANIDWPSTNGLSTAQQKAELVAIMDRAAELRLNTVIFQVRPGCDALYASKYEPWSEYLTGTMGKAPNPYYDPLALAIEEAHKRGLELHAWFNPYRARHAGAKSLAAATHISRTHPEWVKRYGQSLWLDPGEKGVQDYALNVVMDVVNRYDIDGVHFDDYFYPYKEKDASGKDLDFPDQSSWRRYGAGGKLTLEDWRRQNVNVFIRRVYESIKAVKPSVKFGVSPFGIWRPGNPPAIQGYDAFAKLYADSRQWLAQGWLDYCAPQLYWPIKSPEQSFPVLLKWWAAQNAKGRGLAPGIDSTKAEGHWPIEEILNQIRLTRREPGATGHIHWNMKTLMHDGALVQALKKEVYQQPAIFPSCQWLKSDAIAAAPKLRVTQGPGGLRANWEAGEGTEARFWLVQTRHDNQWSSRIMGGTTERLSLGRTPPDIIALRAIDKYGNTGRTTVLERYLPK